MANRNNFKGGSGDAGFLSSGKKSSSKIKGLDNGVLNRSGSTDPAAGSSYGERSNFNFASCLARGENPTGFTSYTPNGVQKQSRDGDKNSNFRLAESGDGSRWGGGKGFDGDMSGN